VEVSGKLYSVAAFLHGGNPGANLIGSWVDS